jgi:molybdate transport system substrate-binding protein
MVCRLSDKLSVVRDNRADMAVGFRFATRLGFGTSCPRGKNALRTDRSSRPADCTNERVENLMKKSTAALWLALLFVAGTTRAAEVEVAVAANFAGAIQRIADEFAKETGNRAIIATGATGKLCAQIENGAPFEVLLAADDRAPTKLEAEGLAVPGSRFTYALGRLVLFSAKPDEVDASGSVLPSGHFVHLAIANPKVAPYGAAALATLTSLGLLEAVRSKLVFGEDIAQTYQFVATGAADVGFVALSQVASPGKRIEGSYWIVPDRLYPAIRQDAVLLSRGARLPQARAFYEYLKGARAREWIKAYGYGLSDAVSTTLPLDSRSKTR